MAATIRQPAWSWRRACPASPGPGRSTSILGMLANKDLTRFLEPLRPLVEGLVAVPVPDEEQSRDPAEIRETARGLGIAAGAASSVAAALDRVLATASAPPLVLVCGSLYLAGHVLRENA